MATTTPNFGWPVPTSTDLVKDGATAIEALGDAIDASLVDLEGGTTGQILAKASNADMDFTWITNDVGDITAVTAGTGITGGGTSGAVTVSFDIANYGGGQWAAGKNKIINGDFTINQRAFTSTTGQGYTFDRWQVTNSDGTVTSSPQTFTAGAAPVAGYEATNYFRMVTSGQTLTTAVALLEQRIEDVRTLAGRTMTISFWAQAGSGTPKIALEIGQNFGTGGSPSAAVNTYAGQATLSTSWARYSITVAVPSISGKTIGTTANTSYNRINLWTSAGSSLDARTGSLGIQSNTFNIWGVQVEEGSTATPFQTATGNSASELAAAQRYYFRINASQAYSNMANSGYTGSTTAFNGFVQHPVTMRIAPTSIDWSGLHALDVASATITLSNPSFAAANTNNSNLAYTAVGATASRFAWLRDSGGATGYLGLSAEL